MQLWQLLHCLGRELHGNSYFNKVLCIKFKSTSRMVSEVTKPDFVNKAWSLNRGISLWINLYLNMRLFLTSCLSNKKIQNMGFNLWIAVLMVMFFVFIYLYLFIYLHRLCFGYKMWVDILLFIYCRLSVIWRDARTLR